MKRASHTSTNPGKRIMIVTYDRLRLEGRFVAEHSSYVTMAALNSGIHVDVEKAKIKQFIVNPRPPRP